MKLNIHPSKLPGLISVSQEEGETLAKLASKRLQPGAVVVEVGVCCGISLAWIALGAPDDTQFYAVDIWNSGNYKSVFNSNIQAMGLDGCVMGIQDTSLHFARKWSRIVPVYLLHIDASHDYENCRADIEAWEPFLKVGGTIALHDANQLGVSFAIYDTIHKSGRFRQYQQNGRLFSAVKIG